MAERVMTLRGLQRLESLTREIGTDNQVITAATITATPDWQGRLMRFSRDCIVTIPSTLPDDFACGWTQDGAGVITFVAGQGETLQSFGGFLKSAGQFAVGGISGMGASTHRLYGNMSA